MNFWILLFLGAIPTGGFLLFRAMETARREALANPTHTSNSREFETLRDQAQQAQKFRKFEDEIGFWRTALQLENASPKQRALALHDITRALYRSSRYEEAVETGQQAMTMEMLPVARARVQSFMALALSNMGRHLEALEAMQRAEQENLAAGDIKLSTYYMVLQGNELASLGDTKAARHRVDQALEIYPPHRGVAVEILARIELLRGEWDAAWTLMEEAQNYATAEVSTAILRRTRVYIAVCERLYGGVQSESHWTSARALVQETARRVETPEEIAIGAAFLALDGQEDAARDKVEASRKEALKGLTGSKRQDVAVEQDVALYLAIADLGLHRHFEAEQRLNNLLRQHVSAVREAEIWFLMGLCRQAAGRTSKARECWEKAAGLDLEIYVCRAAKETLKPS